MTTVVPPPADFPDQSVPWHYGDPVREQRDLESGRAWVDLSNRGVVAVTGVDRLAWLNDLTTALLLELPPGDPRTALILDPNGRVQHELHLVDDGTTTWLIVPPGSSTDIVEYLRSMQFLLRVDVSDVTDEYAVVGSVGTSGVPGAAVNWRAPAEFAGTGVTPSGEDRGGDAGKYVPHRPGVFPAVESVVSRAGLPQVMASAPGMAGTWAWEALRIAAGVPRAGVDTDPRSLPHELGWIGSAVHLAKGCYRGQETVARTHNMGRPPRRLVLLHLDGMAEDLPPAEAPVYDGDRVVGHVTSSARHHELGPIALAVVKTRTDPSKQLVVAGIDAAQETVVASA